MIGLYRGFGILLWVVSCLGQVKKKSTNDTYSIFDFGNPEIFVTTNTQDYEFNLLINHYTRTSLLNEYIVFANNESSATLKLILYDEENSDNVVAQNLRQRTFYDLINTTGTLPSATYLNTTSRGSVEFSVLDSDHKYYQAVYTKSFKSRATVPAYDMIFEIPANSFNFLITKTAVDLQTWGLVRWQLSNNEFVIWKDITREVESLQPTYSKQTVTTTPGITTTPGNSGSGNQKNPWEAKPSSFRRVDNPCLPDFFILYLVVGDKDSGVHHVYMDIPAFHLRNTAANFINMTNAFCPHLHRKSFDECGFVEQLVLTNDHLVALTDKGIYVSSSLNRSDVSVDGNFSSKPLLSYNLIDPCANFAAHISCFKQGITSLASDLIHSIRLFYFPICDLYQSPHYEDRLILVVEHTAAETSLKEPPTRAISVLYSSTPYTHWHSLFIGKSTYGALQIVQLIGIFFNHQLRHFDITLKLKQKDSKSFHYRRFVLPDLVTSALTDATSTGYKTIHGALGKGFLEKKFPGTFKMNAVKVNPGTMDVFFIGSQVWIAESGGSLVYRSIGGITAENTVEDTSITDCFFNHPDRAFVCVLTDKTKLLVGKVASLFTLFYVDITTIKEFWEAAGVRGGLWTMDYVSEVIDRAFFTVSHGGNILMWYLQDREELFRFQKHLTTGPNCDTKTLCKDQSVPEYHDICSLNIETLSASCTKLHKVINEPDNDAIDDHERGAHFQMISIDPSKLTAIKKPSAGPLVPFFIDAESTLLFEGQLPGDDAQFQYFSQVNLGQKIVCENPAYNETASYEDQKKEPEFICDFFIQHSKPVEKFLDGFRLVLYASMLIPPRLIVFGHDVTVMQIGDSNRVLLKADSAYENKHVGQTHYFPQYFSVLIRGFPDPTDKTIVWGFSTVHTRSQNSKFKNHKANTTYLIDLSTSVFNRELTKPKDVDWEKYNASLTDRHTRDTELQKKVAVAKENIQKTYNNSLFKRNGGINIFMQPTPLTVQPFDPVDEIKKQAISGTTSTTAVTTPSNSNSTRDPWTVIDARCHHTLQLESNSYLKSHGGRIVMDLHNHVSFTVKLRPISALGLTTLYRPLIVVTNSNPDVIKLEKLFIRDTDKDFQALQVTLTPTGTKMGVSSIVVRTIITSLECKTPSSMTFIAQAKRAEGSRLQVNYPGGVNWCPLSSKYGGHIIPDWILKTTNPNCIHHGEAYKNYTPEITVQGILIQPPDWPYFVKDDKRIFKKLEANYRPPSVMGEKIPVSENIYNADPAKPQHNNWYHISNETLKYKQCAFKRKRSECRCNLAAKLSDDPKFSDCKEWVFKAQRSKDFTFSVQYYPVMPNEEQHADFFYPRGFLAVYVEEINKRTEFSITNSSSRLVQTINENPDLNGGHVFYDGSNISITLHGTGLFHFRVGLGKFDTFEDVQGYFMLFSDSNELNHIKLAVVMLITITCCFAFIFFGFIRVRRRLSAQLPFQSTHADKFKME